MSAQFALMNSQSQMSHQQLLLKKMKSLEKILKETVVGYYTSLSPSLLLLVEIQCSCHSSLLSSSLAHLISLPPLPFALMNLLQLPSIVQLPVVIRSSCTYFLDIQAPDMFCSCHQHSSKFSKTGIIKNCTHIHTTLLYSFSLIQFFIKVVYSDRVLLQSIFPGTNFAMAIVQKKQEMKLGFRNQRDNKERGYGWLVLFMKDRQTDRQTRRGKEGRRRRGEEKKNTPEHDSLPMWCRCQDCDLS